jgi:DNA polymerase-3 subunit alpha
MEKITVIFDTETTGLIKPEIVDIKEQPEIIEFYGMKVVHRSDKVIEMIDELHSYLKPANPIPDFITKITHIDNGKVENSPSFLEFFPRLAEFHVGVHEWVAHNCPFDSAMVANEVSRIGKVIHFPWPPIHTCTVRATMKFEQRRLNLTRLHEYLFGVGFVDAHSAKGDVLALSKCYFELIKRGVME